MGSTAGSSGSTTQGGLLSGLVSSVTSAVGNVIGSATQSLSDNKQMTPDTSADKSRSGTGPGTKLDTTSDVHDQQMKNMSNLPVNTSSEGKDKDSAFGTNEMIVAPASAHFQKPIGPMGNEWEWQKAYPMDKTLDNMKVPG